MDNNIAKIEKLIQDIIKKKIDISPTEPLQQIIVSSLFFVLLLGEIERVFSVEIPEEDLTQENFKNIDSINNLLNRLVHS